MGRLIGRFRRARRHLTRQEGREQSRSSVGTLRERLG